MQKVTSIAYIWFYLIEKSDIVRQASEQFLATGGTGVLHINWRNALKLRVSFTTQEVCSAGRITVALGSLEKAFCQMQNHIISSFQTTSPETKLVKVVLP